MSDDAEQLALDLEDAVKRLERLKAAVQAKDEAEALVRVCKTELARAKRKAKEAGWTLDGLISSVRNTPYKRKAAERES